jgi:hypothetical protein
MPLLCYQIEMLADKSIIVSSIDTELTPGDLIFLLDYLRRDYLLHRDVKTYNLHTEQNGSRLRYRVLVDDRSQYIDATIDATIPLTVTLKLGEPNISPTVVKQILDDLFLKVQQFEEDARKTTIYFAFVPGEQMVPQQEVTGWIVRLFTDSMLPLYLVLIVFTFLFSFCIQWKLENYAGAARDPSLTLSSFTCKIPSIPSRPWTGYRTNAKRPLQRHPSAQSNDRLSDSWSNLLPLWHSLLT